MTVRPAAPGDIAALHPVVERAYRGVTARVGWTHEADLVTGDRTDVATLNSLLAGDSRLLIALDGSVPIGCVNVANRGGRLAYLGLLCVDPQRQASGVGKRLIHAAEGTARELYSANRIEMTVIEQRAELIAWYERHGYARNGDTRPFPISLDPPLRMVVLVKAFD
ncbi:GNAT family N-acetyltransferase [Sphingomonas turrisvirgatae]|uniref:GNAT family N-acetyltransferase n=1 Tax=Sphingomonas turrisvirgatae TaxID=1888892 RepID=A0A1E3M0J4_9SPHN|nr:GNAT family N-acetyltransferase [Sphingomonas turrisvirgatae]